MTGLENNAHAIGLVCYAPLLCNVDYINWQPDMIWFSTITEYTAVQITSVRKIVYVLATRTNQTFSRYVTVKR